MNPLARYALGALIAVGGAWFFFAKPIPIAGNSVLHGAINGGVGGAMIGVAIMLFRPQKK